MPVSAFVVWGRGVKNKMCNFRARRTHIKFLLEHVQPVRASNKQHWGVSVAQMRVCMCVPVCGWCLAWGHVSSLTTRHPISGKPHNFSKDFPWADSGFLSGVELRTHALPCDYAKYTQEVHTSTILQSLIFKTFFLILSLFSSPPFSPLPSRTGCSSQRQCTGSSIPERVPAGHGVKPNRGILLCTGTSFLAEFHIQVQSYCGWGPKTSVAPWVPQCVAPGRGFTQVRAQPTWQQVEFNVISTLFVKPRDCKSTDSKNVLISVICKLFVGLIVSDMNNNLGALVLVICTLKLSSPWERLFQKHSLALLVWLISFFATFFVWFAVLALCLH